MNPTAKRALKALFIAGMSALLVWAVVYLDGLFGRNHVHALRFYWAASAWSLQQVETAPVQVAGVTAGLRVKALFKLSRDIQAKAPTAFMPVDLEPGIRDADGGLAFFTMFNRTEPVVRKEGQVIPRDIGYWKDKKVVPEGLYEVEQVFWMAGVSPIRYRLPPLNLVKTDYFKTRNTTPYRDFNALCKEDRARVPVSRLSELDGQAVTVEATAWFFNGDRMGFKQERHSTNSIRTSFAYDHAAWMEGLKRLPVPDCQTVFQAVEREVARMAAQIEELERSVDRLTRALTWAEDVRTFSPVEVVRRFFTQEALLEQFPDLQCQSAGTCRSQRLGCTVEFQERWYLEATLVPGTVHALGPRDGTAYLEAGNGEHYFLFQPDQAQPCFVVKADQRLLDPRALAPSAPATMQCHGAECRTLVAQWPRDPGWLADKARRAPEIADRLAETRSILKSAGNYR